MYSASRTEIEELVLKFQSGDSTFEELWDRSQRLFNACLNKELKRVEARFSHILESEEVLSLCMEGFFAAANKFNPNKGAFSTILYQETFGKVMHEIRWRVRAQRNYAQQMLHLDYLVNESGERHELVADDRSGIGRVEGILSCVKRVIDQSELEESIKKAIWVHISTGKPLKHAAIEFGTYQNKAWRALNKLRPAFKCELEKVGI